jgi:hypothetical protein
MTSGVLQTGHYETRDELAEAIRIYYEQGDTLASIADRCGVSARCVRRLVVEKGMARETRPVAQPKPMSIKPHQLRFLRSQGVSNW